MELPSEDIPREEYERRLPAESSFQRWLFFEADRWMVALPILLGVFAAFLVLTLTGVLAVRNEYTGSLLLSVLIGGNFALITIVITINQLVLSREFGKLHSLRERNEGIQTFRRETKEAMGVDAVPPDPLDFLRTLVSTLRERATDLDDAVGSTGIGSYGTTPARTPRRSRTEPRRWRPSSRTPNSGSSTSSRRCSSTGSRGSSTPPNGSALGTVRSSLRPRSSVSTGSRSFCAPSTSRGSTFRHCTCRRNSRDSPVSCSTSGSRRSCSPGSPCSCTRGGRNHDRRPVLYRRIQYRRNARVPPAVDHVRVRDPRFDHHESDAASQPLHQRRLTAPLPSVSTDYRDGFGGRSKALQQSARMYSPERGPSAESRPRTDHDERRAGASNRGPIAAVGRPRPPVRTRGPRRTPRGTTLARSPRRAGGRPSRR